MNRGLLYVTLFSIMWAVDTVVGKFMYSNGAEPYVIGYQVLLFGSIFLWIYIILKGNFKIQRKDIPKMLALGIIGNGLSLLLGNMGLKLSTASNFGFIIKTSVFFNIIFSTMYLKDKLTVKRVILLLTLLVGAYMISTGGSSYIPQIGDILIFLAAACIAFTAVFSTKLLKNNSPEYLSVFRLTISMPVLLIAAYFVHDDIIQVSFMPYTAFLGLNLVFILILLYKTIQIRSAAYMSMMSMMYSVFVVVLGFLFIGEVLNLIQMLGGLVIIISIVLIEKLKA